MTVAAVSSPMSFCNLPSTTASPDNTTEATFDFLLFDTDGTEPLSAFFTLGGVEKKSLVALPENGEDLFFLVDLLPLLDFDVCILTSSSPSLSTSPSS